MSRFSRVLIRETADKKNKDEMNAEDNKAVEQHGKAGRPTKYKPEMIDRLLAALADGLSHKQACMAAGISQTTLAEYRREHPDLEARMDEAREVARQKALSAIKAAGDKDWRAHAEWLRLVFPEYRKPSAHVEVNTTAQQAVEVVCDEATRQAMIAAREQFLRDGKKPQPEQPKLQPGKPIGRTELPGEQPSEDQEQALVPGGATFTPYWEPHGVSEKDLYR